MNDEPVDTLALELPLDVVLCESFVLGLRLRLGLRAEPGLFHRMPKEAFSSGSDAERAGAELGTMLGMMLAERLVDAIVRPEAADASLSP